MSRRSITAAICALAELTRATLEEHARAHQGTLAGQRPGVVEDHQVDLVTGTEP